MVEGSWSLHPCKGNQLSSSGCIVFMSFCLSVQGPTTLCMDWHLHVSTKPTQRYFQNVLTGSARAGSARKEKGLGWALPRFKVPTPAGWKAASVVLISAISGAAAADDT
jgi:hypothetical protein